MKIGEQQYDDMVEALEEAEKCLEAAIINLYDFDIIAKEYGLTVRSELDSYIIGHLKSWVDGEDTSISSLRTRLERAMRVRE